MSDTDDTDPNRQADLSRQAIDQVAVTSALGAVVAVHSRIADNALTASLLGTERGGHGVVFREDGLIVTIGYLITEAESVFVVTASGQTLPAHVVAYDQETGFGVVQALGRLDAPHVEVGSSADLQVGDPVVMAGYGGRSDCVLQKVIAKREFAGYWEYLLDEAIFTAPPHQNWGGTGLIDRHGKLVGIGSLFVQHVGRGGNTNDANMVVPIDLIKPILDDLLMYGRVQKPPRPWLGMITVEHQAGLVVASTVDGGPASKSDIEVGDIVAEVAGQPVRELASMFRLVWGLGEAGVEVPLTVIREGEHVDVYVNSADRNALLAAPQVH
ncbi:MAG: PDZ domain-containing protein [Gammaproteobacteria bacterium]|nr:PDZ domain-containing protein [Gammaproteobacteria bacterium]